MYRCIKRFLLLVLYFLANHVDLQLYITLAIPKRLNTIINIKKTLIHINKSYKKHYNLLFHLSYCFWVCYLL